MTKPTHTLQFQKKSQKWWETDHLIRAAVDGWRIAITRRRRRSGDTVFFLLGLPKPQICSSMAEKSQKPPKPGARTARRLRLSGALAAWVLSPDSAFANLQLGSIVFSRRRRDCGGGDLSPHLGMGGPPLGSCKELPSRGRAGSLKPRNYYCITYFKTPPTTLSRSPTNQPTNTID